MDPHFEAGCLNSTVLDIAYYAYKQEHRPKTKYKAEQYDQNRKYRYVLL